RPDHRVGMILSTVTYADGEDHRKVLYEGYMSEIFVPYMDPAFGWAYRNFIDAGEYTAGGLTKPLLKGLDAPDYAHYMDGLVLQDNGRPRPVTNMIAIFERESGDPSWRHYSYAMEPESRIKRDLVVRCAAVLGNYDYIFDWIFQQDGSIKVQVGATGIAEAKASTQKNASTPVKNKNPGDAYGRFVDQNVVAVNHDHYFSYRLDLDVDGENNSLLLDRLRTEMLPEENPRRSVWVTKPMIAKTESEAKMKINLDKPALWRVISSNRKNHVGYPTSYQLMPGMTGNTLLSEEDYPRKRVGFINYHLWATPFNKNERFAVGDFPTLSLPGQGLPDWTNANRSIENTDVVLWYTIGMHHMVRAEDWPVMPVLWHSFELRPFDFFNGNPALDLPKN
ncbi:MAG: tyramine oxidase, partial [Pricia sp.]|nr:tyramine oxidase [Pricia sp.]